MRRFIFLVPALAVLATLGGCVAFETNQGPESSPCENVGPHPTLVEVDHSLIPTVQIAVAKGWPTGVLPTGPQGASVQAFARELDHPRWLYVLPNGDVLVAETNAPPKPDDSKGLRGKAMKFVQGIAGANAPSANRIVLLRDSNGTGVADYRSVFIDGLNSPFGMALIGNTLYVADTDAILKFPYVSGETSIKAHGVMVADLPAGTINHHWTKNIIASSDGSKLYATVGSNSNVAENGMAAEAGRSSIYEIDLSTGQKRAYATGLRNANGLAWEPSTGALWTVVNERDELGNDLVPDYLTSVTRAAFYGWPYSYYGSHVDDRVKPERPDLVAQAVSPDYSLGSHVAPLGLVMAGKTALPQPFSNGAFVGEHGSWNRKPPVGYKVIFVPFAAGRPSGQPIDVLTGFVNSSGDAYGRPVGVAIDRSGALLVADDVGNVVWRVGRTSR